MNRGNKNTQQTKAKKDDKQKEVTTRKNSQSSISSVARSAVQSGSSKEETPLQPEKTFVELSQQSDQSATPCASLNACQGNLQFSSLNANPCSSFTSTEHKSHSSPLKKLQPSSPKEIIGYVESVSERKRNRKDTTDYSDVILQLEGPTKRRALCFSNTKRQLLLEKKNNRTAVKISKYNIAKDNDTIFINDMTYISKPRPEEYAFQFQETSPSTSQQWTCLKDGIEHCELMSLVNIKAKVLHVGETQLISQKQLKMAETIIFDRETTASLILWEKDVDSVERGRSYNFEQVRIRDRDQQRVFNTTKYTVISLNNDSELNNIENVEVTIESTVKTITVSKIEFIEDFSVSKACSNCNKHIIQNSCEYVLKCDFCSYVMRQESTKFTVIVKIVVDHGSDDELKNTLHLAVFHSNIVKLLNTENVYDEDFVCSSLLKLKNLKITYNTKRNFVIDIEQM